VTIVDLSDNLFTRRFPKLCDHIGLGDTLRVRLPGGTLRRQVFFKSAEADFATQRDVSRRQTRYQDIVLKVRLENPRGAYVPGMTAEVLVSPQQLRNQTKQNVSRSNIRDCGHEYSRGEPNGGSSGPTGWARQMP